MRKSWNKKRQITEQNCAQSPNNANVYYSTHCFTEFFNEDTISSYIMTLKEIFVIDDVDSWNPNIRSRFAIRTSDTRYFIDPSIATAAMGLDPMNLMNDLNTFLMVLTAVGSYAFRYEEGVYIVPISCLKD